MYARKPGALMIDIDRLERMALAATPGPWSAFGGSEVHTFDLEELIAECENYEGQNPNNASFIAAVGPDVVLEIVALIRRLRERVALLEENCLFYPDETARRACGISNV